MTVRRRQLAATDRFQRQRDWINQDRLAKETVLVVGLGAIGKPLVEELAAIGVKHFVLVDHDRVDETNITTQGYYPMNVGQYKALVLGNYLVGMDSGVMVTKFERTWDDSQAAIAKLPITSIFVCVDDIAVRKKIWQDYHIVPANFLANSVAVRTLMDARPKFWGDGRMLAMTMRILSAWDADSRVHYESTLFNPEQAQRGRCTSRSAIWPARIAASLLVNQFVRYLNDRPTDQWNDLLFNLQTYDLSATFHAAAALQHATPAAIPDYPESVSTARSTANPTPQRRPRQAPPAPVTPAAKASTRARRPQPLRAPRPRRRAATT